MSDPAAALEILLQICEQLQLSATYNKFRHDHRISETMFKDFSKQIKLTRKDFPK